MRRQLTLLAIVTVWGGTLLVAQVSNKTATAGSTPDRARAEQVLSAWGSMDPSRAAVFYAKDPGLAFYDVAPRKYTGLSEYQQGAVALFKTITAATFKLGDDFAAHTAGNLTWMTATVDVAMIAKDGSTSKFDARWTLIWEKRSSGWLIVHEHMSVPLPEPAKPSEASRELALHDTERPLRAKIPVNN